MALSFALSLQKIHACFAVSIRKWLCDLIRYSLANLMRKDNCWSVPISTSFFFFVNNYKRLTWSDHGNSAKVIRPYLSSLGLEISGFSGRPKQILRCMRMEATYCALHKVLLEIRSFSPVARPDNSVYFNRKIGEEVKEILLGITN